MKTILESDRVLRSERGAMDAEQIEEISETCLEEFLRLHRVLGSSDISFRITTSRTHFTCIGSTLERKENDGSFRALVHFFLCDEMPDFVTMRQDLLVAIGGKDVECTRSSILIYETPSAVAVEQVFIIETEPCTEEGNLDSSSDD